MNVRHAFSPRLTTVVVDCRVPDKKTGELVYFSRTKQSMKDECDINNIMRKFIKTGAVAHVAKHGGEYGFASAQSFHEAMEVLRKGTEMFEDLPSDLRKKFHNEPAEFLQFVQDEKNADAMRELGLALPKTPEAIPMKVEVINHPRSDDDVKPAKGTK